MFILAVALMLIGGVMGFTCVIVLVAALLEFNTVLTIVQAIFGIIAALSFSGGGMYLLYQYRQKFMEDAFSTMEGMMDGSKGTFAERNRK